MAQYPHTTDVTDVTNQVTGSRNVPRVPTHQPSKEAPEFPPVSWSSWTDPTFRALWWPRTDSTRSQPLTSKNHPQEKLQTHDTNELWKLSSEVYKQEKEHPTCSPKKTFVPEVEVPPKTEEPSSKSLLQESSEDVLEPVSKNPQPSVEGSWLDNDESYDEDQDKVNVSSVSAPLALFFQKYFWKVLEVWRKA